MKKADYKITTYKVGEALIDIVETPGTYEAWIYTADIGIKAFMFGNDKDTDTLDNFLVMAEANAEDHLKLYKEEYDH